MAEVTHPKVVLKKKQVQSLVEFCLDESFEFSVKQQTFPDTDWEIEVKVKDFKSAVLLGMFLRENKMDVEGVDQQRYRKSGKKPDEPVTKEQNATKDEKQKPEKPSPASGEPTLI